MKIVEKGLFISYQNKSFFAFKILSVIVLKQHIMVINHAGRNNNIKSVITLGLFSIISTVLLVYFNNVSVFTKHKHCNDRFGHPTFRNSKCTQYIIFFSVYESIFN